MADFEGRRIDEISGGERQLVMIARALASGSGALVLDEPTSALDFHNQDIILATMRRVAREQGLAIIFSSHYPQHALHIADKALLMNDVDDNACGPTGEVDDGGGARSPLRFPDPPGRSGARRRCVQRARADVFLKGEGRHVDRIHLPRRWLPPHLL